MRIVPVTGDLPAVVVPPPAVTPVAEAPRAEPPVVEAGTGARRASPEHSAQHRPSRPLPWFDPPLIAQRAALGLPVGSLIADLAEAEDISYGAASAAVDAELAERREGRP